MGDTNENERPVKLVHYISYGAYRGFELLLRPFPMEVVCVIGGLIGSLGRLLLPQRRAMVIRNLRIAYGKTHSLEQIHAMCRRVYWNSGANFLAAIRANSTPIDEIRSRVEVQGGENLDLSSRPESGFIILLAHMGNWEILTQAHLIEPRMAPFSGLYRPLGNPLLDRLVKRRRQSTGTKLFSRRDGFFKPIAHLKAGGSLGAIADQNAGAHGVAVPFFGKLTSLTNLPALLYRRTGASIMPVSMCTISHGRWRMVIHPAMEISDSQKKNAALTTSLCARAFETMMSESPSDVLWMHGYWKVGTKRPLKIDGVQKKKNADSLTEATAPFKVLVFTGSAPAESQEMLEQLHRLKNYRKDIEITVVGEFLTSADAAQHIVMNPAEPPHIVANEIRQYDLGMATPLDCAIDFTSDASGENILKLSGITPVFAMRGKNMSRFTRLVFADVAKRNLAGFIESLGIETELP